MIFGNFDKEKACSQEMEVCLGVLEGKRKYALLPTKLSNGRVVWLQPYFVFLDGFEVRHEFDGSISVSMGIFGGREDFCGLVYRSEIPTRDNIRVCLEKPFPPPHQNQMNSFGLESYPHGSEEWAIVMNYYQKRLDLANKELSDIQALKESA